MNAQCEIKLGELSLKDWEGKSNLVTTSITYNHLTKVVTTRSRTFGSLSPVEIVHIRAMTEGE